MGQLLGDMCTWLRYGLCAWVAVTYGCGDDDGRAYYTSGVEGGHKVATLDHDRLSRICKDFDAYVEDQINLDTIAYSACLPQALLRSDSTLDCERSLERCMALFPEPVPSPLSLRGVNDCVDDLRACDATVSELDACINVNVAQALDVYERWSCDLVDDPDVRVMARDLEDLVDVCFELNGACNRFATVRPN